jgi:hypothetical protein
MDPAIQMMQAQIGQMTHFNSILQGQLHVVSQHRDAAQAHSQQMEQQRNEIDAMWQSRHDLNTAKTEELTASLEQLRQTHEQLSRTHQQETAAAVATALAQAGRESSSILEMANHRIADSERAYNALRRSHAEEIHRLKMSAEAQQKKAVFVASIAAAASATAAASSTITVTASTAAIPSKKNEEEKENDEEKGAAVESSSSSSSSISKVELEERLASCAASYTHKLNVAEKALAQTKTKLQAARDELVEEKKKNNKTTVAATTATKKAGKGKGKSKNKAQTMEFSAETTMDQKDQKDEKDQKEEGEEMVYTVNEANLFQVRSELIDAAQHSAQSTYKWNSVRASLEDALALVRQTTPIEALPSLSTQQGDELLVLTSVAARCNSIDKLRVIVLLLERLVRDDRAFAASNIFTMATHARSIYRHFFSHTSLPTTDARNLKNTVNTLDALMGASKTHWQLVHKHLGVAKDTADQFLSDLENID